MQPPCACHHDAETTPASEPRPKVLTTLSVDVLELLDDRIQDGIKAGTIDVLYEAEDVAKTVEITYGELNRLRMLIFPEGFKARNKPRPTRAMPATAKKLEVMAARVDAGEEVTHPKDANPLADDRRSIEVIGTGRGPRMKVEILGVSDVSVNRAGD